MKFSSKANNLFILKQNNFNKEIPELLIFTVKDYVKDKSKILSMISEKFKNCKLAIRSSNLKEDSSKNSYAGYFNSFLNINSKSEKKIIECIESVIKSYKKYSNNNNQILIQKMVSNIKISGVASTCEIKNYSNYYHTISYTKSRKPDEVTSGNGIIKNYIYFKDSKYLPNKKYLLIIINLIKKLEKNVNRKFFEIEFALNKSLNIYLLQIRPVIINKNNSLSEIEINQNLSKLERKIIKIKNSNPALIGKKTIFGVMPDWNPAEMIGTKPRPLALSLYRELITDKVWSEQRLDYGFRDVLGSQLMATFFGTPFVDLRIDFNSFIPKDLPEKLAKKLFNYYINKISNKPSLHDKVEFEILFTCYSLETSDKLQILLKKGFTAREIAIISKSLKSLNYIAVNKSKEDYKKINKLQVLQNKDSKNIYSIDKIFNLVNECKSLGTKPFAGLARTAFIAVEILNSLEKKEYISSIDKKNFLSSIHTVSKSIKTDFNTLNKKNFLKKHGHLRPNTYEITSLNYNEGYNNYFESKKTLNKDIKHSFKLSVMQQNKINKILITENFGMNVSELFNFIKKSIERREKAKHIFTKNIDKIFNEIINLGNRLEIKRNDLSYLDIKLLIELHHTLGNEDLKTLLTQLIKVNKIKYTVNKEIKLPELIRTEKDIYGFYESNSTGNFIGTKEITGSILNFETNNNKNYNDKIICIRSADPGYDFIFNSRISGLITCYGGLNSHMSIRCSELGITAIIGVGESKFNDIIKNKKININPQNSKYSLIS